MAAKQRKFLDKVYNFFYPDKKARYWTPQTQTSWEHYFNIVSDDVPVFSIKSASRIPAVHACIKVLAESIAHPPKRVKRPNSDGSEEVVKSHPVYFLTSISPNEKLTAFDFWYTMVRHKYEYGNGVAEITRDGRGIPSQYKILESWECKPHLDEKDNFWVIYKGRAIPYRDIIHFKYNPDGGMWGCSPLEINRDLIELSLKQQAYSKKVFGSKPPGVLYTDQNLKTDQIDEYSKSWSRQTQGINMGNTPVLAGGFKYGPIMLSSKDAQFIEARDKTDRDIMSIFNVPPTFVQNYLNANYNSTEQENIKFVSFTLAPIVTQIEQEVTRKSFTANSGYKFKIDLKGFLRGDTEARRSFYETMLGRGVMTPDEVRVLEDMQPFNDEYSTRRYIQAAFIPVDKMDEWIDSKGPTQTGNSTEAPEAPRKYNYKVNLNGHSKKEILTNGQH